MANPEAGINAAEAVVKLFTRSTTGSRVYKLKPGEILPKNATVIREVPVSGSGQRISAEQPPAVPAGARAASSKAALNPWEDPNILPLEDWKSIIKSAEKKAGSEIAIPKLQEDAIKQLEEHHYVAHPKAKNPINIAPNSPYIYFEDAKGALIPVARDNKSALQTIRSAEMPGAPGVPKYKQLNPTSQSIKDELGIGLTEGEQAALLGKSTAAGAAVATPVILSNQQGEVKEPITYREPTPPTVPLTQNDNDPAYNGISPVETAIRALSAQRPNEGLTENDNYPQNMGVNQQAPSITNARQPFTAPNRIDLSGSANFNPNAMRWSTDKAPIVQAAQKAVQQTAPAASSSQSSGIANLLSSLFQNKGGEYQSNGDPLYRGTVPDKGMGPNSKGMGPNRPTGVNWGDPDRASDFFRASKALQGLQKPQDQDQAPAEKRGGRIGKTNEHSAILHKALEIIHHMALKNH
jgi:hypothetical protein